MNNSPATVAPPPLLPTIETGAGNLLQPLNLNNNNNPPLCNNNGNNNAKVPISSPTVGSTWSDNLKSGQLNIDWDNLLTSKSSKTMATNSPSMNTLKAQVTPSMSPLVATGGLMKSHQTSTINPSNSIGGNGFSNFGTTMMPGLSSTSAMGMDQSSMGGRTGLMSPQQFVMDNNNLNNINNNNKSMNMQSLDFLQ